MNTSFKEFKLSSWAIDNRIAIYIFTVFITVAGIMTYINLPKESFPDIVLPKYIITTIYGGNSPENIENTITKPLEKKLKSIPGIKKITSTSLQDVSLIIVEFNSDIKPDKARQDVKDKVDEARTDLPADLTKEPQVKEIAFSDMPIMFINLAGPMDLITLKKYADLLKDEIESMKEITEVRMVGAPSREIQINVDMYKMHSSNLTMGDLERAIQAENITISAGNVPVGTQKMTINIKKEFKSAEEIKNILITSQSGAKMYLRDIAEVKDTIAEMESYAKMNGKNVITLQVVKRPGENLIEASEKIYKTIEKLKATEFPKDVDVVVTGDQSERTKITLEDLINTIVIGFLLVTFILMFFMGVTNALFVALSVPLSMFLAFLLMPSIGYSMNMIVLFAFLLALGIVVDDAIVVIENTHRIFNNGKTPIVTAAKKAAGEVFLPVLSGTLTTIAPFVPLAFWKGVIGKFMIFLPVTLIISLFSSLFVAYVINPVFAVDFMKPHHEEHKNYGKLTRNAWLQLIVYFLIAVYSYSTHNRALGNIVLTMGVFLIIHRLWLYKVIQKWQEKIWPSIKNAYGKLLHWALQRPVKMLWYTIALFIFSLIFFTMRKVPVLFFPSGDPNNIYVYIELPEGTAAEYTDKVAGMVANKVDSVLGKNNPVVKSVITNVAIAVTDPRDDDQNSYPNKAKISINFVEYGKRNGVSTSEYLDKLQNMNWNIPNARIVVSKEQMGPPLPKPIVIEIQGDDFKELKQYAELVKTKIDELHNPGIVELKSDFIDNKPEIWLEIDRERANREGISTAQLALEVRKAVYGIDRYSKFKDVDDEYPIQIRYLSEQRKDMDAIKNLKITFRDMNMGGMLRSLPLSSFAEVKYVNTYGGIKHKNKTRIITLSSDVKQGYNPNEIVAQIREVVNSIQTPPTVNIKIGGEQEEQAETINFLKNALMAAVGLILLVLVLQFNSIGKTVIIISEIILSVIGVLIGFGIFRIPMSIVMTGVGVFALAGIVVRNGILLIEFAEQSLKEGKPLMVAAYQAGYVRMTPVILTATAAILGLIPLAVGLNIDFLGLFESFEPHIYFGGDNNVFWGPLSWTMIFGLLFGTFLTLILVPCMFLISERLKRKSDIILDYFKLPRGLKYVPFLIAVLQLVMKVKGVKLDYGRMDE
ncbi:MAG: efflux RND transporter permease subunit [Bacteroidia bacterium]|nr:efflux RND transporter permease subunit [Bacteroidia bacterium]